jgi:hypothetical protein
LPGASSTSESSNPTPNAIGSGGFEEDAEETPNDLTPETPQPEVVHISSCSDSGSDEGQVESNEESFYEQPQEQAAAEYDGGDSMSLDYSGAEDSPVADEELFDAEEDHPASPDPNQATKIHDVQSQDLSGIGSVEPVEYKDTSATGSPLEHDGSESLDMSDDDLYEPPGVTEPADNEETMDSPPFSPAPPETSASDPLVSNSSLRLPIQDTLPDQPRPSSAIEQSHDMLPDQVSTPF